MALQDRVRSRQFVVEYAEVVETEPPRGRQLDWERLRRYEPKLLTRENGLTHTTLEVPVLLSDRS
jgi:hypothetical protein